MDDGKPIEIRAMESLGLGFDLTSDFRLKFAKGSPGERLLVLNENSKRDVVIPGGTTVRGVPEDIRCDKGDRIRFKSDVLDFTQMSELLNHESSVQGKVPSGYLNAIFDLSGSWLNDAAETKYLAFDGYFISLYHFHLTTAPVLLQDKVKKSVPSHWDPAALSRFIRRYGTHIIVGMAIGGQDLICVKQKPSSTLATAELRQRLEDLGDFLFSDGRSPSLVQRKCRDGKQNLTEVYNRLLQSNTLQLTSVTETSNKDGITVMWSKRGGDVFSHSHSKWLQTVPSKPEAIRFKFVPITSLLTGVPGSGYLSHAINLYLRYKPLLNDLQQFLEFQVPTQWAPLYSELPLGHQGKKTSCPSLQFTFFGPKIQVSSAPVVSACKPVTGVRMFLEGKKHNRLAIHLQHLSTPPNPMSAALSSSATPCRWLGSDDYPTALQFLEPLRNPRFSNVCTSPVRHDPAWLAHDAPPGVFIVTGARLVSGGKWPRTCLHLRLLFTHLPCYAVRKTGWAGVPENGQKTGFFHNLSTTFNFGRRTGTVGMAGKGLGAGAMNSGVYPGGPPVGLGGGKILRFVETGEVVRGAHDAPGHWLVLGGKLVTDGGKIGLHVKFGLLDYLQQS